MYKFVALIVLLSSTACSSETDIRTQFALDVLEDNMSTTDFTALVETQKMTIVEVSDNTALLISELVAVRYSAIVIETYIGKEAENITYTHYVEKGEEPEVMGNQSHIISLCQDENGDYYLPDIGYELPADRVTKKEAKRAQTRINNKRPITNENGGRAACN